MSNKDQYKKAFSVLETSWEFNPEDKKMALFKRKSMTKNLVAAAAIILAVICGSGTAYAANVGGIQRTLQLWIHGDQTSVTLNLDGNGNYSMKYTDKDGKEHESGGGGIAIEPDGTERPLTNDEIMEDMYNDIDVEYADDGKVTLYYMDQVVDITDKFKDGYCYIKLQGEGKTIYVTIKYNDGWSTSTDKYPDI